MIEENSQLGSITAIDYLLNLDGISNSESIESLCAASSGYFRSKSIFLSTLNLLEKMEYVDISGNKVLKKKNFNRTAFLFNFISYLDQIQVLNRLFSPSNLKLDSSNNQYYVFTNSISLELSSIRNFLIDSKFLIQDSSEYKLYINNEFKNTTEDFIFPLIEKESIKRGLTPEGLKKILAAQEQHGLEAELFVLAYERKRLSSHQRVNSIQHVAAFNVSAGFDILSFSTNHSYVLDREIEVKSYTGRPEFYLSKSEYDRAEKNKNGYFIYLVDRDKMEIENYNPEIIENPFDSLKNSKNWACTIDKYFYCSLT